MMSSGQSSNSIHNIPKLERHAGRICPSDADSQLGDVLRGLWRRIALLDRAGNTHATYRALGLSVSLFIMYSRFLSGSAVLALAHTGSNLFGSV